MNRDTTHSKSHAPTRTKEEAHRRAKRRDARDVLTRGAQHDAVIFKSPSDLDGTNALTKLENVKTFVRSGPGVSTTHLHTGTTVRVKIVDVGDSHAEALAVAVLD